MEQVKEQQDQAAKRAWDIYINARDIENIDIRHFPFLEKIGMKASELWPLKVHTDGRLILPVLNSDFHIVNLLFLDVEESPRRIPGGQVEGGFFFFGGLSESITLNKIYLCRKLSSALTLHRDTGQSVFLYFTETNLEPVIDVILSNEWFKPYQLVLASDNEDFDAIREVSKRRNLSCFLMPDLSGEQEAVNE